MFKVSQEIRLKTANSNNSHVHISTEGNDENIIFGRYHKTPDPDLYFPNNEKQIYVAPELTDTNKVQLLNFPTGAVRTNTEGKFVIKRNGTKGNFEVTFESPSGLMSYTPLKTLDPERFEASFQLNESGLYKVHIKCNSVPLPRSPFIIVAIAGESEPKIIKTENASQVSYRDLQLNSKINTRNEFIVDCSKAGNNIIFVGILGPSGQCDEVAVRHLGMSVFAVAYQLQEPGEYLLAVKWGENHIPGSPFNLTAF